MHIKTAPEGNNGGGAGTNGPPTKPTKKLRDDEVWMTVREVMEEARRSDETVYAAIRSGHLPASQAKAGCPYGIRRDHFKKWVAAGCPARGVAARGAA